ncbi:MAG: cbb3-type cytochrome c oxidase N-terminal domain-containing protein [Daejeonella sp.]|uniref:cbb3-type cytochrome c oxidase N-terminal domain-containing protein n=1 Tax=Daejeonella sp. TaxID=2805397 RepID=UPI003C75B427
MKRRLLLCLILVLPIVALAQGQAPVINQSTASGNIYTEILIIVFIVTALIILMAALSMLKAFRVIAQEMLHPQPYVIPESIQAKEYTEWKNGKPETPGIWTKILGLKPLSEEKDILMEHQFDGISELDNPTPAWFMWLFYGTIAFALVYMVYFHVLDYGLMQEEEYEIEMVAAQEERKIFLASSANNIDESSVKVSTEAGTIDAGKSVYTANCVACHGDKGQGSVGPNLTDPYWIHGGTVGSIFKTIKYGVPEKGMISWEKMLTPKQISDLSNYILSLKGTNPPNGKAPQGNKEG